MPPESPTPTPNPQARGAAVGAAISRIGDLAYGSDTPTVGSQISAPGGFQSFVENLLGGFVPAATPAAVTSGNLTSDAQGPIDIAQAVLATTAAMTAAAGGLCVEASLGVFREAMRAQGVRIIDSEVPGIQVPAIADASGKLISGKAFATLWYSNTGAEMWARLPQACRGGGAPGALLYGDLVKNRKLVASSSGWPAGLEAGAFLQLWLDHAAFLSVRDDAQADVFGHSAVFEAYVPGEAGKIVVTDQTGVRRTVDYPMYGCTYVIGANVGKGKLLA